MIIKKCELCGKEYETSRYSQKWCSLTCREKAKKLEKPKPILPAWRECPTCHKNFKPFSYQNKYCSMECRQKADVKHREEAAARRKAEQLNNPKDPVKNRTLQEWCALAAECNMDYGNYRAQIEIFGKTHEELKALGEDLGVQHRGSHIKSKARYG